MKNINFYFDNRINNVEKMSLIKENNFDGIFLMCDDEFDMNVQLARKNNLYIESAHLPYKNVCNSIWLEGLAGDEYTKSTIKWIERIANAQIKIAVIHMAATITPPQMSEIGFTRFLKIVSACEKNNVILAMENVHEWNYVFACLERTCSKNVGICLDFGHANAFSKDIMNIDYKNLASKIVCLHIHDNMGERDQHLIPFDGNIDFEFVLGSLKKHGFKGCLTLELECEKLYTSTDFYIKKAKQVLDRLGEIYEKQS